MAKMMSNGELAGYAAIHCETPRALFHKGHVIQLHWMAGIELDESQLNDFEEMHEDIVRPLLKAWEAHNS